MSYLRTSYIKLRINGVLVRSILNPAHKLRQRMLHFVQTLQHYMFYEVIEPNWLKFVDSVEKVMKHEICFVDFQTHNFEISRVTPSMICCSTTRHSFKSVWRTVCWPIPTWSKSLASCCRFVRSSRTTTSDSWRLLQWMRPRSKKISRPTRATSNNSPPSPRHLRSSRTRDEVAASLLVAVNLSLSAHSPRRITTRGKNVKRPRNKRRANKSVRCTATRATWLRWRSLKIILSSIWSYCWRLSEQHRIWIIISRIWVSDWTLINITPTNSYKFELSNNKYTYLLPRVMFAIYLHEQFLV